MTMKYFSLISLFVITLSSCSKSNNIDKTCNYLLNVEVTAMVNMSFPQYSQLQFISNAVPVNGYGNKGLIVMNTGTGFVAWDASDNRLCSALTAKGGKLNPGLVNPGLKYCFVGRVVIVRR